MVYKYITSGLRVSYKCVTNGYKWDISGLQVDYKLSTNGVRVGCK